MSNQNKKQDKWRENGLVNPYINPEAPIESEDDETVANDEYEAKIARIPTAVATPITPESNSDRVRRSWRNRPNQRKGVRPQGTKKHK